MEKLKKLSHILFALFCISLLLGILIIYTSVSIIYITPVVIGMIFFYLKDFLSEKLYSIKNHDFVGDVFGMYIIILMVFGLIYMISQTYILEPLLDNRNK